MGQWGALDDNSATTFGLESAWAKGSVLIQGESFFSSADDTAGKGRHFWGGYIQGSIILTGESRPYRSNSGIFGSVVPAHNFSFREGHWGAWEWTARTSYVDLNDGDVEGGEMTVLSTGLNCYLTERNRIMFVLGMADVNNDASDGELYFIQTRFQVEF